MNRKHVQRAAFATNVAGVTAGVAQVGAETRNVRATVVAALFGGLYLVTLHALTVQKES